MPVLAAMSAPPPTAASIVVAAKGRATQATPVSNAAPGGASDATPVASIVSQPVTPSPIIPDATPAPTESRPSSPISLANAEPAPVQSDGQEIQARPEAAHKDATQLQPQTADSALQTETPEVAASALPAASAQAPSNNNDGPAPSPVIASHIFQAAPVSKRMAADIPAAPGPAVASNPRPTAVARATQPTTAGEVAMAPVADSASPVQLAVTSTAMAAAVETPPDVTADLQPAGSSGQSNTARSARRLCDRRTMQLRPACSRRQPSRVIVRCATSTRLRLRLVATKDLLRMTMKGFRGDRGRPRAGRDRRPGTPQPPGPGRHS